MSKKKEKKKVLIKDIVIPKGTVFSRSPNITERYGEDHFECIFGLSNNTHGIVYYDTSEDKEEIEKYFVDLIE